MKNTRKMPTIITIPSHNKCRQTKEFLIDNGVNVIERNVYHSPLSTMDLIQLSNRAGGLMELVAKRSKAYPALKALLDKDEETKMSQVFSYILAHPRVLKYPIVFDDNRFNIGYNEDEIRAFLPRDKKNYYFMKTLERIEQMKTA